MPPRRPQPKKQKKKKNNAPMSRRSAKPIGSRGAPGPAEAWKRLLLNPCSAALASPPYSGSDAGYLIRTVDIGTFSVAGTGLTIGGTYKADYSLSWSPWNTSTSTGLLVCGGSPGTTNGTSPLGVTNFVATSTSVREYRPVAACLKWIPTGAIGTRSGSVASGYSPGLVMSPVSSYQAGTIVSLAQHSAGNGSENHEVNWIPTAQDEVFTSSAASSQVGVGTVFMALSGVDGTASSATNLTLNGYFEMVTVYEWVPAAGSSLSNNLKVPSAYTTQQILSTFRDISQVVFAGIKGSMPGMMNMGSQALLGYANGYLRSGVPLLEYRRGSMR